MDRTSVSYTHLGNGVLEGYAHLNHRPDEAIPRGCAAGKGLPVQELHHLVFIDCLDSVGLALYGSLLDLGGGIL